MKGLILAAGEGKRLGSVQYHHKSLVQIRDKRVIDYSMNMLSKIDISEYVIVVGYHADDVRDYLGDKYEGIPIKYVIQSERLGIAHAVMCAKEQLADEFVLCLADEILINDRLDDMVRSFHNNGSLMCMAGVIYAEQDFSMKPIAYDIDEKNKVKKVREKPDHYENNMRGVGECIFSKESLDILEKLQINSIRNEYEMGDWIQLLIENDGEVETFEIADDYININKSEDIEKAQNIL